VLCEHIMLAIIYILFGVYKAVSPSSIVQSTPVRR
jgi:hypothetical protein